MPAARYERKILKDIIRDAIYDAIILGELKPGDRIIEMDWAEKFGSSQAPVREAIRDLEARGVVETTPFKGAAVRILDIEKIREIHAIRSGLEAVALNKVIRSSSDEEIQAIKNILDEMLKAAEKGNPGEFLDKDVEFHEEIVDLANMPDLKIMWNMCNIRFSTVISTNLSRLDLLALAENHKAIWKKIEGRDLSDIYETISNHFLFVSESCKEDTNF